MSASSPGSVRMTSNSRRASVALITLAGALGCMPVTTTPPPVDANNHRFFPIGPGTGHALGSTTIDGDVTCESCHRMAAQSLADVHCDTCHKHPDSLIAQLHLGVPDAGFPIDVSTISDPLEQSEKRSAQCASCHPAGAKMPFSHTGITDTCEQCHAPTTSFAALPKPGFTHSPPNPVTCFGCHKDVTRWSNVNGNGSLDVADPSRSLLMTGLVPSFSGTSIARVSPLEQTLPMKMVHASPDIDAGVLADCGVCHLVSGRASSIPPSRRLASRSRVSARAATPRPDRWASSGPPSPHARRPQARCATTPSCG